MNQNTIKEKVTKTLFMTMAFMGLCGTVQSLQASGLALEDSDTVYWDQSYGLGSPNKDLPNFDPQNIKNPAYELHVGLSNQPLTIDLISENLDCYLYLFDKDGLLYASDDDGGNGYDSRLHFEDLPAGTYKLVAGTYSDDQTGVGKIEIRGFHASVQPHNVIWNGSGGQTVDHPQNQSFTWVLDEPGSVDVKLSARNSDDAFLYVVDSANNVTYTDNNSGVGNDAHWSGYLDAGTYRLVATTNTAGKVGTGRISPNKGVLIPHNEDTYFDFIGSHTGQVPVGYNVAYWADTLDSANGLFEVYDLIGDGFSMYGGEIYVRYTNIRKPAHELTQKEWDCFESALMGLKSLDNYGAIFGEPNYEGYCLLNDPAAHSGTAHYNDRFLPWGREYLRVFEKGLQRICPSVTIPFWDVTVNSAVPARMEDTILISGEHKWINSPYELLAYTTHWNPYWDDDYYRYSEDLGDEGGYWAQSYIDVAYSFTFDNFRYRMEYNYDYGIRYGVGGILSYDALSAYDPMFWLHKSMIDYQWALWQDSHLGMTSTDPSYSLPLVANVYYAGGGGYNLFKYTGPQVEDRNFMNLGYSKNGFKR